LIAALPDQSVLMSFSVDVQLPLLVRLCPTVLLRSLSEFSHSVLACCQRAGVSLFVRPLVRLSLSVCAVERHGPIYLHVALVTFTAAQPVIPQTDDISWHRRRVSCSDSGNGRRTVIDYIVGATPCEWVVPYIDVCGLSDRSTD